MGSVISTTEPSPGRSLSHIASGMFPTPVARHLHEECESHFFQRRRNYSQLLVVGIVQSCPLVLLVWLPLDGLEVGIQVGAVQAVVILNQACGAWLKRIKIPIFVSGLSIQRGGSPRKRLALLEASLLAARAAPDPGQDELTLG